MNQLDFQRQQQGWVGATTVETQERVRTFIRSVYAWMFGGLLLTALASFWVVKSPAMQQLIFGNRSMVWILFAAELGLVFFLSFRIMKMTAATAASVFLVFSLLNGLTLSSIFFVYTMGSIPIRLGHAYAVSRGAASDRAPRTQHSVERGRPRPRAPRQHPRNGRR